MVPPKWTFEWFDDPDWVAFTAKLDKTDETLNGHEELLLKLVNVGADGVCESGVC